MRRFAMLLGAAQLAACGLSHTVDREFLRDITIEQKLLLFEAQNDVAISLDERQDLLQAMQDSRARRLGALRAVRDAEEDRDRAQAKGNAKAVEVATLAIAVLERKSGYLEEELKYQEARLELQDTYVIVARAKLELAKARLVLRNNVRGAAGLDVVDFEQQVEKWVTRAQEGRKELRELGAEVDGLRKGWLQQRAELAKKSGGAQGNPWVEDMTDWEDDGWQADGDK